MGNSDSSASSQTSWKRIRDFSPSPIPNSDTLATPRRHTNLRNSGSFGHHSRKLSNFRRESDGGSQARSRSFRRPSQNASQNKLSLPSAVCPTTGLTMQQKLQLSIAWRQLPRSSAYAIGELVFGQMFSRSPDLLHALAIEHLIGTDDWRKDIAFRVHSQQFSQLLSHTMRHLHEPALAADRLQEFGAEYAELEMSKARIRPGYWEMLMSALTATAIQIADAGSDCPEVATAWATLAQFLVNQMRFGYNMERMLQGEMRKLGLQAKSGSTSGSNSRRESGVRL